MEDQLSQLHLSSADAPPEQPADSPIAALPVETLQHILQLAREDSSPPEAARTLKSFSLVCKLWYDIAQRDGEGELLVANSQQAERLTKALLASPTMAWQTSIRAVVIPVERGGGSALKSQRVGDLLLALPRLERLYLELEEGMTVEAGSVYNIFGKPLLSALEAATSLKHFHLELGAEAVQIDVTAMLMTLSRWPNLRTFTAPTLECRDGYPSQRFSVHTFGLSARLQQISIGPCTRKVVGGVSSNRNGVLLVHLLANSTHAIRSLTLGPFYEVALRETAGRQSASTLRTMLEEAAPRLHHLDIRDGVRPTSPNPPHPDYLVSIIERLTSIRTLTLGCGGLPSYIFFPLLGQLDTLVELAIVTSFYSPSPTTYKLDAEAAFNFIAESK